MLDPGRLKLSLFLLFATVSAAAAALNAGPGAATSCAEEPANLLYNGSMAPGSGPSGVAGWSPFVLSPLLPIFEHAANEGWDPGGSQYVWRDEQQWDAGIYQQVLNTLAPGVTYHAWFVWGQAVHEVAGEAEYSNTMMRQLGVDPTGGTNPAAPSVLWAVPHYGRGGFNRPEWHLHFQAISPHATVFLRARNFDVDGRNKVFFDVACLQFAAGAPPSTPWATPSYAGPRFLPSILKDGQ